MRDEPLGNVPSVVAPDEWGPGYRFWRAALALLAQRGPDGTTSLVRVASHLILILVAVLVLVISRLELPGWDIAPTRAPEAVLPQEDLSPDALEAGAASEAIALQREAVPFTLIPERPRIGVVTHVVAAGDTLYALAQKYGLAAETLVWANNMEQNPDLLRLGQQLVVLPLNGVYHTVGKKDTLESIAKQYKAKVADIVSLEANSLNAKNPVIAVGQKLIVPGGVKPTVVRRVQIYTGPVPANASAGSGRFVWPTTGYITQAFKPLHPALDIAGRIGLDVKASDSGYVVAAGWSDAGYGNYVVIDHKNGFQTLYGHLSRILVNAGDPVSKGTVIGLMGSTGRSTGPHLHFEVHQNGIQRNPFSYLP